MPDAGLFIPDLSSSRYGIEDYRQAFERPEREARLSGLHLELDRQLHTYPTPAAHALVQEAQARGNGHEMALAISKAYFMAGRNISDPEVLAGMAAGLGFTRDEVFAVSTDPDRCRSFERDAAASAALGVRSVPTSFSTARWP